MKRLLAIVPIAALALAMPGSAAHAQSGDKPSTGGPSTGGDVGDQFKDGAQRIGEGAERIGEGIKQGAIQAWEAVKAGASAAGDKLNGTDGSAPKSPSPPPPTPPSAPQD